MKHEGLNTHRFKDNPLEQIFAREWAKQQQGHVLAYLLTFQRNEPDYNNVSDRDATVAATVIQWLGSPVGQAFLRDVSKTIKKEKTS